MSLIKRAFSQRYFFARLTRIPVLGVLGEHIFFEHDRMVCVPMDTVVEVNVKLERPGQSFLPSAMVEHFINSAGRHWIMDECICRSADHCKDYPIGLGCLHLGEATGNIDPRLGRAVTKQEALDHLRRCREAGLVHMVGRNKLDTIWMDVKPGHRLMTICNCCPCCCLWKMLPSLSADIGAKITKMPGVSVTVTDKCVGCGTCMRSCFLGAIRLLEGHAVIGDECRGCGRCAAVCPKKAIEVSMDSPLAESIELISASVDVS